MAIAILGSSRGLGSHLAKHIQEILPNEALLLSARKKSFLEELARSQDEVVACDFSQPIDQDRLIETLVRFSPTQIFYVAGGGPYGAYEQKGWKDHAWAIEVTFGFPARLLHTFLKDPRNLKKMVFVGSSVAEDKADPGAASYAAAKHALRGLIKTVQAEQCERRVLDVRLFSPGYMDTHLLPPNSWPRQQGLVTDARDVARTLWQWSQSPLK